VVLQEISVVSSSAITLPGTYLTTVLADSPLGYWRLGESSGTTLASEVNSPTLDADLIGGATLGAPGLISDADTAITSGFATAGGGRVPYDVLLDQDDTFTLEIWYTCTWQVPADSNLLSWGTALVLAAKNNGTVVATAGGTTMATSTVTLTPGIPYHIVFTKDGSTRVLYVNGVDVTSLGTNVTISITNSLPLQIAGDVASSFIVDEAAIYASALTAQQVLDHYLAGVAPQAPISTAAPTLEYLSPDVGTQLSCLPGKWTGSPTAYGFQWQTSSTGGDPWSDLTGETLSTYIVQSGDTGDSVRCEVVASNAGGDSAAAYTSGVAI
jgi:hypothetical protein